MEQEDIKATAEEMKQEAVRRLKMINYYAPAIERFEKEGVIMFSEGALAKIVFENEGKTSEHLADMRGMLYEITPDSEPKFYKAVKDFEQENECLAYAGIHTKTEFGELLTILYVTIHKQEWGMDNEDLKEKAPCAYVVNFDTPEFSEFGSVGIECINGGLYQTA
jgi:hypothetical protein